MLPESDVREILLEAISQNRRVKGVDRLGSFHGQIVDLKGRISIIKTLTTGELRALHLDEVQKIKLNGGGGN